MNRRACSKRCNAREKSTGPAICFARCSPGCWEDVPFAGLGCWAVILGVADISEAAWRKRVRLCGDWLHWLLTELVSTAERKEHEESRPRVILVDGTSL